MATLNDEVSAKLQALTNNPLISPNPQNPIAQNHAMECVFMLTEQYVVKTIQTRACPDTGIFLAKSSPGQLLNIFLPEQTTLKIYGNEDNAKKAHEYLHKLIASATNKHLIKATHHHYGYVDLEKTLSMFQQLVKGTGIPEPDLTDNRISNKVKVIYDQFEFLLLLKTMCRRNPPTLQSAQNLGIGPKELAEEVLQVQADKLLNEITNFKPQT